MGFSNSFGWLFTSDNFKIKVINQPAGYACGVINPDNVSIKLKGKGWQLLSLALGVKNDFALSADSDSGLIQIDPINDVSENNWIGSGLSIIEINPRNVSLNVERIIFKNLKLLLKQIYLLMMAMGLQHQ